MFGADITGRSDSAFTGDKGAAFPCLVMLPWILRMEPAIIFRKQLEERCIPIGKGGSANDATNLNQ
jgi:hypothetical protein